CRGLADGLVNRGRLAPSTRSDSEPSGLLAARINHVHDDGAFLVVASERRDGARTPVRTGVAVDEGLQLGARAAEAARSNLEVRIRLHLFQSFGRDLFADCLQYEHAVR